MTFEAYCQTLEFKPMDTLPWELNTEFDPPIKLMPLGLVLKARDGYYYKFVLVGNNVDGDSTTGCSCCSQEWKEYVENFVGWSWAFGDQ